MFETLTSHFHSAIPPPNFTIFTIFTRPSSGQACFCESIHQAFGHELWPTSVIETSVSLRGQKKLLAALLQTGEKFSVSSPVFGSYVTFARTAGRRVDKMRKEIKREAGHVFTRE